MHDLPSSRLQCDEIWSFVYSKVKNVPEEHNGEFGYGDVRPLGTGRQGLQ